MKTGQKIEIYAGENTEVSYPVVEMAEDEKPVNSVVRESVATRTGAGAVPLTSSIVKIVTTGANALTLADGEEGQRISLVMVTDGGDGTLTPANFAGGTTATFNDAGDVLELLFLDGDWHITLNKGVTIA